MYRGSKYHRYGGRNTMAMGAQYIMGRGVDMPWIVDQNTMERGLPMVY